MVSSGIVHSSPRYFSTRLQAQQVHALWFYPGVRRVKERRSLSYITNSLPLIKGKGIKGMGFPDETLKGEGLVKTLKNCPVTDCSARMGQGVLATVRKNEYHVNMTPPADEVHLRRLTVDEALLRLDQYLNDAFMAGLYQVKVIHGKGTGTLRQAVHEQLARHPLVKSYRLGGYGEGGIGVTIVELAQR
jgi:hypothetical protein